MPLEFAVTENPKLRTAAEVAEVLADPGFGARSLITWLLPPGRGAAMAEAEIRPYGPFQIDPAGAVLHYGRDLRGSEGLPSCGCSIHLFRPEANARRLQTSAARMMLPQLPVEDFVTAVEELVRIDQRWVPDATGERACTCARSCSPTRSFLASAPRRG